MGTFGQFAGALGMQAAQTGLGGAMGLILGGIERKKQLEQQRKLQALQIEGAKQMGIFNREQQMQLWKDTNYSAQMDELKKAGLNPGLLYGHGGPGGSTNASPGAVSGAQAAPQGPAMGMGISMGSMQLQLLQSQKELMQAQTEKTRAEAGAIPVSVEKTKTETASLLQGIENQKSQKALTDVQTAIASIDEHIKGKTQNEAVATIMTNLEILNNDADISNQTKINKIKMVAAELHNKITDTLQKEKSLAKTDKEMQEIDKRIQLMQQEYNLNKIDEQLAEKGFNPKNPGILKWIANMVDMIFGRR